MYDMLYMESIYTTHSIMYVSHDVQILLKAVCRSNKQIMPEVIIFGCIYALPANRDLMRAEGPKHIPIY